MDWTKLFVPEAPLLEIFIRGTVVYLCIFFYFRFFRRSAGAIGITDILLIVLVADAAESAMAGADHSITAGLLTVATLAFWDYFLDWLAYRFPAMRRLIEPRPLLLVRDGQLVHKNVAKEMMTAEDVRAQLRQHDVSGLHEVQAAFMEPDGKLSVVKKPAVKRGEDPSPGPSSGGGR